MNIGLVLSGGMAKGAYQIGALKAISEFIPTGEIKYISCSSVGVLNGYAYATGKLHTARNMWQNICQNNNRMFITQVLKSELLQNNIKNLYSEKDELPDAFYCSLLDFAKKNIVYKNLSSVDKEKIPLYLKASVAMPIYNRSVNIDGTSYFDGAMIDNISVYPMSQHKLDYIICIYFDNTSYKFENSQFDNKIIKITFPSDSILKQSVIFRKDSIEKMFEGGYDQTKQILSSVFENGYQDLEYIYKAIVRRNLNEIRSLRITGDVLVTNLNKVTQKFAKRKIKP